MNTAYQWIVLCSCLVLGAGSLAAAAPTESGASGSTQQGHQTVTGRIKAINPGSIVVEIKKGQTRNFSAAQATAERLRGLKVGSLVRLELDEGNLIIDIDPAEEAHTPHQQVTGTLAAFDRMNRSMTLTLKDGTRSSYRLKDAAAIKMGIKQIGEMVTVEIDEENGLVMEVLTD